MADEKMMFLVERLETEGPYKQAPPQPRPKTWLDDNVKWIVVTVVIPLTTFIYGYWQSHIADLKTQADRDIAEKRLANDRANTDSRDDFTAITSLFPALSDSDQNKVSLASGILAILYHDNKDRHSAGNRMLAVVNQQISAKINSTDVKQKEAGAQQRQAVLTGSGKTVSSDSSTTGIVSSDGQTSSVPEIRPDVVFLQTYTAAQRQSAVATQDLLRRSDVAAPGIDDVAKRLGARARPHPPQVRYFHQEDLGAARWTAAKLHAADNLDWQLLYVTAFPNVPAGQLEVWWPYPAE